jgi:hypothetical protein
MPVVIGDHLGKLAVPEQVLSNGFRELGADLLRQGRIAPRAGDNQMNVALFANHLEGTRLVEVVRDDQGGFP